LNRRMIQGGSLILALALLCGAAFAWLYAVDNKYTAALPAGEGRSWLEAALTGSPRFLVDGWEYYPGQLLAPEEFTTGKAPREHIYAGQYPNFSDALGTPYGVATYRMVLTNPGEAVRLSLFLPEIPSASRVYIGGELMGETGSVEPYLAHIWDTVYTFEADGDTEIIIQAVNHDHYYGGLYYPPAVGTPDAIARMIALRMTVYGVLCFGAAAVALSNLALWLFGRPHSDKTALWFGILCAAFAVRVSYPFWRMLGVPSVRLLYALEDMAAGVILLCAAWIAASLSGRAKGALFQKAVLPACVFFAAATALFPLFILPHAPLLINGYGVATTLFKLFYAFWLVGVSFSGLLNGARFQRLQLAGAVLFGVSQLWAVLSINRFEPVCGAWPEEYGAFLLVVIFSALMVCRGREMAAENLRLTEHLQEEVDKKTQYLETLLSERKELLANLIHDLKNPLTAVRSYTELVRGGGVALDGETTGYLDALSERVVTMEDRFGLLQGFSRGERGVFQYESICLNDLLHRFYEDNRPDVELYGQSFELHLPKENLSVSGNTDRLRSALENLCYNALSFTPEDGIITLSLREEKGKAVISVADTGVGIAPEDLPYVFDRGFTTRPDGSGDGLGLFLVRTITLEHGGTVEVDSQKGKGSVFIMRIPKL